MKCCFRWKIGVIICGIATVCVGVILASKSLPRRPICKDCNVILISLDTLSSEHLPCYGYIRNTAPALCDFAQKNYFFPHAYGNGSYTLPTHVSMFTGLYPRTHGMLTVHSPKLPATTPFFPSILKSNGYTNIFIMDDENAHMPMDKVYYRGIDTQFGEYTDSWNDGFTAFEKNVRDHKKTFLFVHSYYVHPPFSEKETSLQYTHDFYDWMFWREEDQIGTTKNFIAYLIKALQINIEAGTPFDAKNDPILLSRLLESQNDYDKQKALVRAYPTIVNDYRRKYDPLIRMDIHNTKEITFLKAIYDGRIRQMDEGPIRELLSFINTPLIQANTVVIITSDHGEEFNEHGYLSHTTLYDPNTHIFLAMGFPDKTSRRVDEYVQTADLTPTMLDILGISSPYVFQGVSIVPTLYGKKIRNRLLVAEDVVMMTARLGKLKLFFKSHEGKLVPIELYNTETDPGEEENILFSNIPLAEAMLASYNQIHAFMPQKP